MKLLFDQNISFRIISMVAEFFPESKHVSSLFLSNSEDSAIWKTAKSAGYSIVTFDSDFYDMSLIYGSPPKIIWLRIGNVSTERLKDLLLAKADVIHDFIMNKENSDKACLEID